MKGEEYRYIRSHVGWGWKSSCFRLRKKCEVKSEPKSTELLDSLLGKRTEMESLRKKKEQEEEKRKEDEERKEKEVDDILQLGSKIDIRSYP